jgi:hypothetical protein
MLVEIGICTGFLLIGRLIAQNFSGLSRSEQESILARRQELDRRRDEVAAAEKQAAAEKAAAEKQAARETEDSRKVETFLESVELGCRINHSSERLTPEYFVTLLAGEKKGEMKIKRLKKEITAGVPKSLETKAYLALSRRQGKKGIRHDA